MCIYLNSNRYCNGGQFETSWKLEAITGLHPYNTLPSQIKCKTNLMKFKYLSGDAITVQIKSCRGGE